jgi:hypothetical protein
MRLLRFRPSPGTVIACVAVVLACTGSATAATLITGQQIKNNSLTTKDVKNKSLRAGDFKPGDLPRGPAGVAGATGPQGPQGSQGPQGGPGLSAIEYEYAGTSFDSASPKEAEVTCPEGKTAISAGYNIVAGKAGTAPNTLLEVNVDVIGTSGAEGFVEAYETDGITTDWGVDLALLCARVAP